MGAMAAQITSLTTIYLLNRLFKLRSKKTSKLLVTGFCAGNSPVTGEFPAQMASDAENISIWWRHHGDSFYHTQYIWFKYLVVFIAHFDEIWARPEHFDKLSSSAWAILVENNMKH